MLSGRLLPAILMALAPGCAEQMPEPKPVAPDLSALLASYQNPTLTLDQQTMPLVADGMAPVAAMVDKARALVPAIQAVLEQSAAEATKPSSLQRPPSLAPQAITGEGFAVVDRICPGWEDAGPNPANGYLHLTVGFTEQGIDPVVWGTAEACKLGINGSGATLSGSVQLSLGNASVKPEAVLSTPLLLQVQLELTIGESTESIATDFRVDPAGALEYRVFVGELAAVYWDQVTERGYRAANGRFTCDFDLKQCVPESGPTLSW